MKLKNSFDHFMWMKTVGKLDGMKITGCGVASIPESSIYKFINRKHILDKHGVEYPDWKTAREVLKNEN